MTEGFVLMNTSTSSPVCTLNREGSLHLRHREVRRVGLHKFIRCLVEAKASVEIFYRKLCVKNECRNPHLLLRVLLHLPHDENPTPFATVRPSHTHTLHLHNGFVVGMDSAVPDHTEPRRPNCHRLLFSSPLFLDVRGILVVEDKVDGVRVMAVELQRGRYSLLLHESGISNYCGVAKDVVVFALSKTHNKWHHRPLLPLKKKKGTGKTRRCSASLFSFAAGVTSRNTLKCGQRKGWRSFYARGAQMTRTNSPPSSHRQKTNTSRHTCIHPHKLMQGIRLLYSAIVKN
ncbi:hypothetical protein MOQ_001231 [Trypanosoma cruzi marinkellei]|uniref:Uncharacterized protein n=1 Tax=Trypanosoma cruzi marinkellei TaxID=85056 RepID=K2MTJ9_TRYCR|nr:hypothetical protein MOQ_001231 [Trypanosoma cruzi marinkellei]